MFDDPQKELKRLEEQLLKQGMNDEEFERFYRDIYAEFGPVEGEQPVTVPAKPKSRSTYADTPRAVAPKKKKGIRGLVITVGLEFVGIVAIIAWWLVRIL